MRTVLGIDLGTQSLKLVCYDYDAMQLAAVTSAPLELDQDPTGKAEQDPAAWLTALQVALAEMPTAIRATVQAIGVSGQQHGLVAVDHSGRPLRAAKLWCDTTTAAQAEELMDRVGGRDHCITLSGNALVSGFTAPKILWLKQHEPERYAAMSGILLPHDYLNFVLTGVRAMEYGDASGTGLLDLRTRQWRRELLDALDSVRDLGDCLPPFVEPGACIGVTTAAAAERFGLPAGVPVAAGGGDNMMGAIGTGNVTPGRLTMSLGTSGTLYGYSSQPIIDPKGNIAAFCDSTGGWLPLLCTMNCTVATELMRAPLGVAVADIDAAIEPIAPGADGVLVLPFFNGERTPNMPRAKACVLGLDAGNTSRAHLLRATVEGATFALRFGIDELATLGLAADAIVLTGGGANSRVWRQIVADVSGLPVSMLRQNEGAGFGAALQALWSLKRLQRPACAIGEITSEHVAADAALGAAPDAARHAAYADVYRQYQRAVRQVTPLYTH
jgi:xylulokinase